MNQWLVAGYVLAAVFGAGVAVLAQRLLQRRGAWLIGSNTPIPLVLLFDGPNLLDCSAPARALLRGLKEGGGDDWARLMHHLSQWFADVQPDIDRLSQLGQFAKSPIRAGGPYARIAADWYGGLTRLTVTPNPDTRNTPRIDDWQGAALLQAPIPVWQALADGQIGATNGAFALLADALAETPPRHGTRLHVQTDGQDRWFDLQLAQTPQGQVGYALPATDTVRAETALRDFVQTLGKTFAQLPIGLAVFDRERSLQMFNPALGDLTGLAPDFLARQPTLTAVLDAMRDRSMIPEPKDWRNWRKQLAEIERAAASDGYHEVWNLPGGQTYRVSGRPHPNGGLALIIEDISTETIRTRRYRADLELGQAVIDAVSDGMAVFAPSGQLVLMNAAYADFWGHDPASTIGGANIGQMAQYWRGLSAPTPLWAEIEDFVAQLGERHDWQAEARLSDGRLLACRISALAGGATLVAFCPTPTGGLRAQSGGARALA